MPVGRLPAIDLTVPAGEPALAPPDSLSWRVFKNPIALFIGGVTAVILELAEPRVRTGVWEHTSFRTDPLARMERTGLAAMVTVYGPRSRAEAMIAGIGLKHSAIGGRTPAGEAYRADDRELLDWVQATASFGFLTAYSTFVHPIDAEDRDRFYAEGEPAARLYGALGAPRSEAEQQALFARMQGKLEAHEIIFEFLAIMQTMNALPRFARPLQAMLVKAGIEITPPSVRVILGVGPEWNLRPWQRLLVKSLARLADRLRLASSPPVQACRRLGLPASYLYRRQAKT